MCNSRLEWQLQKLQRTRQQAKLQHLRKWRNVQDNNHLDLHKYYFNYNYKYNNNKQQQQQRPFNGL